MTMETIEYVGSGGVTLIADAAFMGWRGGAPR